MPCQLCNVIREVIRLGDDGCGGQRAGDGVGYPRKKSTSKTYSWTKDSIDKGYVHKLLKPFINKHMNIK